VPRISWSLLPGFTGHCAITALDASPLPQAALSGAVRHFKDAALGDPALTGEYEERLRKVSGQMAGIPCWHRPCVAHDAFHLNASAACADVSVCRRRVINAHTAPNMSPPLAVTPQVAEERFNAVRTKLRATSERAAEAMLAAETAKLRAMMEAHGADLNAIEAELRR
jgi:hypothetical protein